MVFNCGRQRTMQCSLTWCIDSILSTTEKNLISLRSYFSASLLLLPTISYIVVSISRDWPPPPKGINDDMRHTFWGLTTQPAPRLESSDLHIIELVTVVIITIIIILIITVVVVIIIITLLLLSMFYLFTSSYRLAIYS